jgi:1,5-anhydro-D-fructose reductase (1,5-anhydro-D-mannitol-forming)
VSEAAYLNRTGPRRLERDVPGNATLGWGIVGASAAAARTVPALRGLAPLRGATGRPPVINSRPVGVFSHSEHRGRVFADAQAIPHFFVNLADLLAHPEIACIYVGNHPRHHAAVVFAALAAGKHVLCEPPLALSLEEAQNAAHTALSRGLVLGLNYLHRADPAVRTLRDLLVDRTIGDVLGGRVSNTAPLPPGQQTWRLRLPAGGAILDRTAFSADLLRFLLRDEVAAMHSLETQRILGTEVEEDVLSHVTLRRSGLVFQLHDSFLIHHLPASVAVVGSTGTLIARHCLTDDTASELLLLRHSKVEAVPLAPTDLREQTLHAFVNAVRTQGAPSATGADGVQSLAASLAADASLRRGQRMPVGTDRRHTDRTGG